MYALKHDFFCEVRKHSIPSQSGVNARLRKGVRFSLVEYSDKVHIANLQAITQKRNDGSHFMEWFTGLADQFNVTLELQPSASFLNTTMNKDEQQAKLIAWYSRYGFVEAGNYTMIRVPNYNARKSMEEMVGGDGYPTISPSV